MLKGSKAAESWTKWEGEMKRGRRPCWDERQEQWQSGEDNFWTSFHSLVSRKAQFWHMSYIASLASPAGILAGTMTAIPCKKRVMLTHSSLAAAWPGEIAKVTWWGTNCGHWRGLSLRWRRGRLWPESQVVLSRQPMPNPPIPKVERMV